MNPTGNTSFELRLEIQDKLEKALQKRGYKKVSTPLLYPAPPPDPEIQPFTVKYEPHMEPDPPAQTLFLHTSPELAMKRLLARGFPAIYQVCPAFRQGEKSPLHSPEFTIAEWYRPRADYFRLMKELDSIILEVLGPEVSFRGRGVKTSPAQRLSLSEAMKLAGVRAEEWSGLPTGQYRAAFHRAFVEKLGPWLEEKDAVLLYDFPRPLSLLAKTKPNDPETAERFELFIAGVEVVNGCTELEDPEEYRRRFHEDQELRKQEGKPLYPLPESFLRELAAAGGLPPCAGAALGVDRLAMLAADAGRIEEVLAFPFGE